MSSTVISPLGVLAVSALASPLADDTGRRELEHVWGKGMVTAADDARRVLSSLDSTALAVGAWTRASDVTTTAREVLGSLLQPLPTDTAEAQRVLDTWARDRTFGLIENFPAEVAPGTTSVLASAAAVDDTWQIDASQTSLDFDGRRHPAFQYEALADDVRGSADGRAVRLVTRLTSGVEYVVVRSLDGVTNARSRVSGDAWVPLDAEHPLVRVELRAGRSRGVIVRQPSFRFETRHDLTGSHRWGFGPLCRADHGLSGLHPGAVADQIVQSAMIEVSESGLRAAAVTAMMMLRGLPVGAKYDTLVVEVDGPFAFEVRHPDIPAPLFTGVYEGDHPVVKPS